MQIFVRNRRSVAEIRKMLDSNTNGFHHCRNGVAELELNCLVIAQLAKERDILTVGIVTVQFEGKVRIEQALAGWCLRKQEQIQHIN
jgi:cell division protein FtsZ